MKKYFLLFTIILVFTSCKNKNSNPGEEKNTTSDAAEINMEYPDGVYRAVVEYYEFETDRTIGDTLEVIVQEGQLIKVNNKKGSWLDEKEILGADVTDGDASFESSTGYEFKVKLLNRKEQ